MRLVTPHGDMAHDVHHPRVLPDGRRHELLLELRHLLVQVRGSCVAFVEVKEGVG